MHIAWGDLGQGDSTASGGAKAVAYLCFAVCVAAVAYGLYTLL